MILLLEVLGGNVEAEKIVENIITYDIYKDNGMNILIEKLNYVFKSKKIDDLFKIY